MLRMFFLFFFPAVVCQQCFHTQIACLPFSRDAINYRKLKHLAFCLLCAVYKNVTLHRKEQKQFATSAACEPLFGILEIMSLSMATSDSALGRMRMHWPVQPIENLQHDLLKQKRRKKKSGMWLKFRRTYLLACFIADFI